MLLGVAQLAKHFNVGWEFVAKTSVAAVVKIDILGARASFAAHPASGENRELEQLPVCGLQINLVPCERLVRRSQRIRETPVYWFVGHAREASVTYTTKL